MIRTAAELYAVLQELHRRKVPLPAGVTITGLVNRLPPSEQVIAQKHLAVYDRAYDGDRLEPFGKPLTKEVILLASSHDSPDEPSREAADWILETARQEVVTAELIDRMGSDADRPPAEPTLRDYIDAAVTAVAGDQT